MQVLNQSQYQAFTNVEASAAETDVNDLIIILIWLDVIFSFS